MQRMRAALCGLLLCIWIMAAAGCAGQKPEQPASSEEATRCWATVTLEGGSGKASVESPCPVLERSGELLAVITWSSSHYDFMIVDGEKILPVNKEGNSQFEIPLKSSAGANGMGQSESLPADCEMQVQADTTAMSTPHLVDYTLSFRFFKTKEEAESAGESQQEEDSTDATQEEAAATSDIREAPKLSGLQYLSKDENEYAQGFAIYRYENEYTVLAIDDGRCYLVVPEAAEVTENVEVPEGTAEDLIILRQPLDRIYLAASAVMCQFDEIGAVDNVILSGLEKDGWYIKAAREAMEKGTLEYGGKYSAPDYERIVASGVNLAVESTMIHHTPKVQEKLEKLGIPVLIDRKSYVEALRGNAEADAANTYGSDSAAQQKTVAIFSINSTRQVVTRGAGDYFGKMVEIAGGTLSTPATDTGRATQTVSMESFYAAAEQADILIYNASIEDAPEDLQQMCAKDSILTQFRAVREGNVWCMRSSLYQNASRTGAIIRDLHAIVAGEADEETEFFYRLK